MPTRIDDDDRVIGLPTPEHEAILRRVVSRLTGTDASQEVMIGRYRLVRRLGAGGMGVVYLVHDPDLDRLVALKVLHVDSPTLGTHEEILQRRMRREARALARLDHPHVVRVYEVGEHQGRIYLAMEYVEGTTLTQWLDDAPTRPWEDLVQAFVAAGEGLAAAHAAGLAHCDFKPDNVLIGHDGAIKVGDFGLVRSLEDVPSTEQETTGPTHRPRLVRLEGSGMTTRKGEVFGTPFFMAPEQLEGLRGDSHGDQFAFCVALYTALAKQPPFTRSFASRRESIAAGPRPMPTTAGPLPTRLVGAIERGLHDDRDQRWPSMDALLAELRHALGARARRRRRSALAAAGAVVLGVVAWQAHAQYERSTQAQACAAAGADIDAVWNAATREAVQEGLMTAPVSHGAVTADKIMPWLDRHADDWRRDRTQACTSATLEGELDEVSYRKAQWCLDERRRELAALLGMLHDADAQTAEGAIPAVMALRATAPCVDAMVLRGLPEPPSPANREAIVTLEESLAEADALAATGKYRPALGLAEEVLTQAERLGWLPLVASARSRRGSLLHRTGNYEEALATDAHAFTEASHARAWGLAADVANAATHVAGHRLGKYEVARVWSRSAETAELLAGDPLELRRANRLDALGAAENAAGNHAEAERLHTLALHTRERALGPDHFELTWSMSNLGNAKKAQGNYDGARVLYERALAIRREVLGSEHPMVAGLINNIAVVLSTQGEHALAQARFEEVLDLRRRTLGPRHHDVATAALNLAATHQWQGHLDQALQLTEEALSVLEHSVGPEHRDVAMALGNLAALHTERGAAAQAVPLLERALTILEQTQGTEHPYLAQVLIQLADARLAQGDTVGAQEAHARSARIRELVLGPDHPDLAMSWFGLAQVALAQGRSQDAIALAERAAAVFEAANLASRLAETRDLIERATTPMQPG